MKNIILIILIFIVGLGAGVAGSMLMRAKHKPYYRMKHRGDLSEDEKNKIKTLCDFNSYDDEEVLDKDYHPAPRPPEDAPMSYEKDDLPPPPESF